MEEAMTSSPTTDGARLRAARLTLAYDERIVATDLGITVPDGSFTAIIGPNASGKSTLLRALSRMMRPQAGAVHLDGTEISRYSTKEVARRIGLLPQTSIAPAGITVADLVARGRYPHQRPLRQWSDRDEAAVTEALHRTGTADLAERFVDELSGGQRQRVWLALVLAQETSILLLDEPTTYLDIAHQVEVLDLCSELQRHDGFTVVTVLHEINLACRYATHLVVMNQGTIVAEGDPTSIVTAELISDVFGLRCQVFPDPEEGTPLVIPAGRPAG
jgi:iron complex transport system ATP-binding protein